MSLFEIALGVVGAGVVGSGFVWARRALGGIYLPPQEKTPITLVLPELLVSDLELAQHRWARPIVEAGFRQTMGRDGTEAELQYEQAVSWLETKYGKAWSKAQVGMDTANNWGAVTCNPKTAAPGTCNPGITDSLPDGSTYQTGFRRYATPEDGSADVAHHIFQKRPHTALALSDDAPTCYRASYAMRREAYYSGVCPKATAKYSAAVTKESFAKPDQNEGCRACSEECVTGHAQIIYRNARAISQALSKPLALGLGSYEDADQWYRETFLEGQK